MCSERALTRFHRLTWGSIWRAVNLLLTIGGLRIRVFAIAENRSIAV